MARHPYVLQPATARWAKSVAGVTFDNVDPVVGFPFKIQPHEKVATAGSCFAQHIARHLKKNGFNYYVAETGHPIGLSVDGLPESFNYGTFSARYGNLYTSRQLLQLFKRAYGTFVPQESVWPGPDGSFLDPFRPTIQPSGFSSEAELIADREQHLASVRTMFETLDIFVFTLGLTENWFCRADGAALPICPGVSGGVYDEQKYGFENLSVTQILADMNEFLALLSSVNPAARVVLTVSPVPLAATMCGHALTATTYSKSALRVVCEELNQAHGHLAYFPSYEIITGAYNRGRYFAEDLRSVTEEGVSHVMRLFLKHAADTTVERTEVPAAPVKDTFLDQMTHVVKTTCDEELIEASMNA